MHGVNLGKESWGSEESGNDTAKMGPETHGA